MKYLSSSPFSDHAPVDQQYRDNWEATFGKGPSPEPRTFVKPQTLYEQVREFHEVYGQPINTAPTVPAVDRVKLRLKLIAEEFVELLEATAYTGFMHGESLRDSDCYVAEALDEFIDRADVKVNLVETADALADLMYVIQGAALEFGIDLEKVLAEVHRSNLSKLGADGKPVHNADGKVIKGPNYSKPDIAKVLNVGK